MGHISSSSENHTTSHGTKVLSKASPSPLAHSHPVFPTPVLHTVLSSMLILDIACLSEKRMSGGSWGSRGHPRDPCPRSKPVVMYSLKCFHSDFCDWRFVAGMVCHSRGGRHFYLSRGLEALDIRWARVLPWEGRVLPCEEGTSPNVHCDLGRGMNGMHPYPVLVHCDHGGV